MKVTLLFPDRRDHYLYNIEHFYCPFCGKGMALPRSYIDGGYEFPCTQCSGRAMIKLKRSLDLKMNRLMEVVLRVKIGKLEDSSDLFNKETIYCPRCGSESFVSIGDVIKGYEFRCVDKYCFSMIRVEEDKENT